MTLLQAMGVRYVARTRAYTIHHMYVLYDDTRSFIHEMNDDRIMSRTCLRQRSVIITDLADGARVQLYSGTAAG